MRPPVGPPTSADMPLFDKLTAARSDAALLRAAIRVSGTAIMIVMSDREQRRICVHLTVEEQRCVCFRVRSSVRGQLAR